MIGLTPHLRNNAPHMPQYARQRFADMRDQRSASCVFFALCGRYIKFPLTLIIIII